MWIMDISLNQPVAMLYSVKEEVKAKNLKKYINILKNFALQVFI
jgi:hypothetical protein